nr:MAG TPA: hypothetical protein [Caudoviricetes sp.]
MLLTISIIAYFLHYEKSTLSVLSENVDFFSWSYWPDLNRRPADYESILDSKKTPKMGFFREKTSFSSILKFPSLVRPYFGKNIFILISVFLRRHFCHV